MSRATKLISVIVAVWAGLFIFSIIASTGVEGPRNIDTGFRRLDVLARYQIMAFGVAVVAAIAGFLWRKEGKRVVMIGAAPLALTLVLIGGLVVASFVLNQTRPAYAPAVPNKPTAPAAGLPATEGG